MQSYSCGPVLPLLEKTIGQVLANAVARNPSGDALISRHQGLRISYTGLQQHAERTARGLWGLGLRPGDRVGVWACNCVEWVYLQLATALTGTVLVNVNPAYRAHELRYVLGKSGMKAIFLHERDARVAYLDILNEARKGQGKGHSQALAHVVLLGSAAWDGMLADGVDVPALEQSPHDVVNIQYTSGTTGSPKGVLLTHRNLVNNAYVVGRGMLLTPADRLCSPVPLYHCFGCVMSSLLAVVHAIALVMPAAQFDPLATLHAIDAERCTVIYGVPTMFIAELDHPDFGKYNMSTLRTGIMAGAPCPVEVMKRVIAQMHCGGMSVAYGQTESSPAITMSAVHDSMEHRVATIGQALPETEVKIVAPWNDEILATGQRGELCARGYMVMKGYDREPEATARAVSEDGWLRTGDLAVMRDDGYLHIVGRLKEMIIRGGENIYPREIEEFLHQHPKIADVYVVGLPDARLGESVLAWIKLKAGEAMTADEVRDYCRGQIAHFKVPQYIRFVDAFPMTVTGKVQKFRIREQEIEALGLHAAAEIQTA
ncbi:MAG TPA: AMP-binding protein [Bryobacteraceae bacterium]|nr:AMP-binding protein [Bryobacteraceae bacterium]